MAARPCVCVNVLIVTDSQHGSGIFGGGSVRGGAEGILSFKSSFYPLPVLLPYLFLSLPGRTAFVSWIADQDRIFSSFKFSHSEGIFFCATAALIFFFFSFFLPGPTGE